MAAGKIPKWIEKSLSSSDLEEISRKIADIETKTSGEVVPLIVRSSSATGHVSLLLSLLFFAVLLWCDLPHRMADYGGSVLIYTPLLFILSYFLALPASKLKMIQRVLTADRDEEFQVYQRAELEFYRADLRNTTKRTGILIFVSLMERRVVVLADTGISSKLPPETWSKIVQNFLGELKAGSLKHGLLAALDDCGKILAQHIPPEGSNLNEIPNQLILKD